MGYLYPECIIHAYEVHANYEYTRRMHVHEIRGMKYTPMKYTVMKEMLIRYMILGCIPLRYTPIEMHVTMYRSMRNISAR